MPEMKAAYIKKYGKHERLSMGILPVPQIGDTDVLVEVHSASLNPIDFKVRDGRLKLLRKYSFPLILGHDMAGRVLSVGRHVNRFRPGERVFARPRNGRIGTLAELIAVDQDELAHVPSSLSYPEAASIPLVGLTTWQALIDVAKIKSGDRVFIQAGSGGIGTFAIQLAKCVGCHVITTTSARNTDFVISLGADQVIDYRHQNFDEILRNVDVVFDTLGGDALYQSFRVARRGGWIVSISGDPDRQTAQEMQLDPLKTLILQLVGRKANLLARRSGINYRFLFMKSRGDQLNEISKLIEKKQIHPVIDRIFSFEECQKAMDYLEAGRARGKVIVNVRS